MSRRRLKYLVDINRETLGEDTDPAYEFKYIDIGAVGRGTLVAEPEALTFSDAPSRARRLVREGDTIISTVRTYLRAVLPIKCSAEDLVVSTGFAVLSPRSEMDPGYLGWLAQSDVVVEEVVSRSVGVSYPAINASEIGDIVVPIPPVAAQQAIANFLGPETARIDALIERKRRMVELLEEWRNGLATDLLLGPRVEGGGAGPGQVTLRPGWSFVPFRWLFREIDIRSQTGTEALLSVSQTRGVIPQSELGDRHQYAETLVGYKVCLPGDLVINRMWVYYGALGAVTQPGIVSPDYAVFRPTAQMSSEFAAKVLRTPAYVGEMTRLVRGIGAAFQGGVRKPRLHPSELGLIQMPVSTRANQQALLDSLDGQTKAITYRVSLLNRSIELLEERRQALITAAVTGELRGPGVAA